MAIYYEDLSVGDTFEGGEYHVTEQEIVEFAEQYDPQWFHTDPDRAAEESIYGGLIASGWHTAAMTMRMLVEEVLSEVASMGAKGVDELRWHAPVRPGDTLSIRNEVIEKVPERDDRGLVHVRTETIDEGGSVVYSMIGLVMVARRS